MNRKDATKVRAVQREKRSSNILFVCAALLCALTTLCFWSAINNDFTNWDDNLYVTESHLIRNLSLDNTKRIFSSFVAGNYHPLTMISLAIDFAVHGLSPAGYHATNVAIHIANTLLVFAFISSLSASSTSAFITALLFGLHPLHVESVAWVSERKDVLYVFFYLAALYVYLFSIRTEGKRWLRYTFVMPLFIAALLSKGQAVTLPVAFLLLDWFERRGMGLAVFVEKIPFVVLSIIFGVVAVVAQQSTGAILDTFPFSFPIRLLYACTNLWLYVGKLIAPIHLSIVYPYPSLASWGALLLALLESLCVGAFLMLGALGFAAPLLFDQRHDQHSLTALSAISRLLSPCYRLLASRPAGKLIISIAENRSLLFGGTFFLANIVLHLQLLPVGPSRIAERYTYLSSIGLFFVVGQLFSWIWMNAHPSKAPYRHGGAAILSVYFIFLGYQTVERTAVWRNSETLWSNVLKQFPQAVTAYLNRGNYYQLKGDTERALTDFTAALALNPNHVAVLANRCDVLKTLGRLEEAIADCGKVIARDPTIEVAYTNRGIAFAKLGNPRDALLDFDKAISLQPSKASLYFNRAALYDMIGSLDRATKDYSHAISLNPQYAAAYYFRGLTKLRMGEFNGAISDFDVSAQSAELKGRSLLSRSQAYMILNNTPQALADALEAQRVGMNVEASYLQNLQGLGQR